MLERMLILSAVLFVIGLYGALSRRHIIAVLISVEIMFNAVMLAMVAVSRYVTPAVMRVPGAEDGAERFLLAGQSFTLFIIVVAAAEVALGLALVIALVRRKDTTDLTEINMLRH
ncbi:MAG: NADH-quinone oxidoreductase subunit NuoK [Dehalococcoidia bacterium]